MATSVKWHSPLGSIVMQIEQVATYCMSVNSYLTELATGWSCDNGCVTSEIEESFLQWSWNRRSPSAHSLTWISHHCTQQTCYTFRSQHEGLQSYVRRDLHKQRKSREVWKRERERELKEDGWWPRFFLVVCHSFVLNGARTSTLTETMQWVNNPLDLHKQRANWWEWITEADNMLASRKVGWMKDSVYMQWLMNIYQNIILLLLDLRVWINYIGSYDK